MTPNIDNKWMISFIQDFLPRFPDNILIEIFNKLPFEHLIGFFIYFPSETVQSLLLQHYYSGKLCFTFTRFRSSEFYLPFWNDLDGEVNKVVEFDGEEQISQGIHILTKVVPKRLTLFWGSDFKERKSILKQDCIRNIPELEIGIESYQIKANDFYDLISLPNLTKLHLRDMCNSCITPRSSEDQLVLRNHGKLTEIAFLKFNGLDDLSNIELPQGLKILSLDPLYGSKVNLSTLNIPKLIQRLDIQCFKGAFKRLQPKLSSTISFLRLSSGALTILRIDALQDGLCMLNLSRNKIKNILGKEWPANLYEINLSNNKLDDHGLGAINTIGWPERLTKLDVSSNQISRIENLHLPPSLEALNISNNPFQWSDEQVLEFPDKLKNLDMSRCQIKDLQYIKFPPSLEMLEILGNDITNILSYPDWSKLINLRKLDISYNKISSFDNWEIPPNVINLDLGHNPIEKISSEFPLFDRDYNFHVVELGLSSCKLANFELDYIPPSLRDLDISDNEFPEPFVFTSMFKQLNYLDVSGNDLTAIVFDDKEQMESCVVRFRFGNFRRNRFRDYL